MLIRYTEEAVAEFEEHIRFEERHIFPKVASLTGAALTELLADHRLLVGYFTRLSAIYNAHHIDITAALQVINSLLDAFDDHDEREREALSG